jgi:hypothetical protein
MNVLKLASLSISSVCVCNCLLLQMTVLCVVGTKLFSRTKLPAFTQQLPSVFMNSKRSEHIKAIFSGILFNSISVQTKGLF